MTNTTDLLRPLADAQAALKAAKTAIRKSNKAIDAVRSAHRQAEIAEAELAALRGGIREWGADPTNLQNMYAQLASRTRQWKETKAELATVRAAYAESWQLIELMKDLIGAERRTVITAMSHREDQGTRVEHCDHCGWDHMAELDEAIQAADKRYAEAFPATADGPARPGRLPVDGASGSKPTPDDARATVYREDVEASAARAEKAEQRAEQAEAILNRVWDLADHWEHGLTPDQPYAQALRAALGVVRVTIGVPVDGGPTPVDALRDRVAAALTAEHYRRAHGRIVASPEEHSAAMADVVMRVLVGPSDAETTPADGPDDAQTTADRAFLDRAITGDGTGQQLGFVSGTVAVDPRASLTRCSPLLNPLCTGHTDGGRCEPSDGSPALLPTPPDWNAVALTPPKVIGRPFPTAPESVWAFGLLQPASEEQRRDVLDAAITNAMDWATSVDEQCPAHYKGDRPDTRTRTWAPVDWRCERRGHGLDSHHAVRSGGGTVFHWPDAIAMYPTGDAPSPADDADDDSEDEQDDADDASRPTLADRLRAQQTADPTAPPEPCTYRLEADGMPTGRIITVADVPSEPQS